VHARHTLHNGWSKDHFELAPVDLPIEAHPDVLIAALDRRLEGRPSREPGLMPHRRVTRAVGYGRLAASATASSPLRSVARLPGTPACLVRLPLGWDGADLAVAGPLDYLGQDGGAGIGSGPGMAVGAALALAGSDRLAVAVLGDGDTLMGSARCGRRRTTACDC
jgi:hypothetical protein